MNRFVNLDGSGHTKLPKMIRRIRKTINAKIKHKGAPAPSVKPKMEELLTPMENGAGTRITWLGHSGWLIQTAGKSILIDPVLGKRINAFLRRKVMFNFHLHKLKSIEAVLISHDHYDHLHVRFLKHIGSQVIAGTGMERFLKSKNINATELKWWESVNIDNIKITFVPAKHDSRRGILDSNMRLWGGFIIEAPGICIYHAGDTAYFNIFKEIAKSFKKIDVAFLPIGSYSPENIIARKNHLNPEQAVKAFMDLKAEYMFPMHWGTYQMTDEPMDEPPTRLIKEWQKNKLDNNRLKIMAVGESVYIK